MTALYPRLVGSSWGDLPERMKRCHAGIEETRASGYFDITWGEALPSRWLARLSGLPRAGKGVPTELIVTPGDGGEIWRRRFAGRDFTTLQWAENGYLIERAGCVELRFRLTVANRTLTFEQAGAVLRAAGVRLPLPRWLAPVVSASVWEEDEIRVRVELSLPGVGFLCRYEGSLWESRA